MTSTFSSHSWLRRLSDYHSGGVSDSERLAVETHLGSCAECQEALTMYRRFYMLLRSPLSLGVPRVDFFSDEPTTVLDTATTGSRRASRPGGRAPRDPRRRALAGVAAALVAALVIAGFAAVFALRPHPAEVSTPTAQPSVTVQSTVTPQPTATTTPQPSAFVCANPQGSNMTYAYTRGDLNVYAVTGCGTPRQLTIEPLSGDRTAKFPCREPSRGRRHADWCRNFNPLYH
jgi:hypothetical protein